MIHLVDRFHRVETVTSSAVDSPIPLARRLVSLHSNCSVALNFFDSRTASVSDAYFTLFSFLPSWLASSGNSTLVAVQEHRPARVLNCPLLCCVRFTASIGEGRAPRTQPPTVLTAVAGAATAGAAPPPRAIF